jgi:hypothetical protein
VATTYFEATADDEMTIASDDRLLVHKRYDDGWCLVSRAGEVEGRRGVVPARFLRPAASASPTSRA